MEKRYQIFVSSTYKDLGEYRQLVIKALMQVNAIPAGMELFPAADEDAWTVIQRAIDESDYYLVIIGGKYGSTDPTGISYTEKEYDYAVEKGRPVIAFLHQDPGKLIRDLTETDAGSVAKLEAFREKAKKRHCRFWLSRDDLVLAVLASYQNLIYTHPSPGWIPGDQAKTIEDVEKLSNLQQRVAELEQENASLRSQAADDTSIFAQGADRLEVAVEYLVGSKQESSLVSTTWDEIFAAAATMMLQASGERDVVYSMCKYCCDDAATSAHFDPLTMRVGGLDDDDLFKIKNQFLALRLMSIQIGVHGPEWKLTQKGQDYYARLHAIRRQPPTAPLAPPAPPQTPR